MAKRGGNESDCDMSKLLRRLEALEEQVAACVKNQPLIYQLFEKCNQLERRLNETPKEELAEDPASATCGPSGPKDEKELDNVVGANANEYEEIIEESGDPHEDEWWHPDPDPYERADDVEDADHHEAEFSCKVCPSFPRVGFKDAESLANHYTSMHPLPDTSGPGKGGRTMLNARLKPNPRCPKCHKVFVSPSKLDRHLKSNHNSYECEFCQAKFGMKKEVVAHQRETHAQVSRNFNLKPVPCPDICGRTFRNRSKALAHLVTCRGQKPHECATCGKKYAQPRALQLHKARGHKIIKAVRVTCTECGRSIAQGHLRKHMETHTPSEERLRLYCDQCGVGVLGQKALRRHKQRAHGDPDAPRIPCNLCDKTFKESFNFLKHMALHTDRGRHICDECGWGFPQANYLRKHKESHAKGTAKTVPWSRVAPTAQ